MSIDITPIVQAVIALLASVITAFVIPWVKAHTKKEQLEIVRSVASVAVMATEQLYNNLGGEEKYEAAKKIATAKLASMGLSVDPADIEAAVHEMNAKIVEVLDTTILEDNMIDDGK